ncbi:MAG: DUF2851 family protein [Rikenellaceae bacterium]|nr:DUF2851 family protein [Rikenellaceae bacterium]
MNSRYQTELLHILWTLYPQTEYTTPGGETITVLRHGEYDENRMRFCGAKIKHGDNIYHGEIVIWSGRELPAGDFESTVLHVTPVQSASILRHDGQPVMQVIDVPDPVYCELYRELRQGRQSSCGRYVAGLESHQRLSLFTRLMVDRLYNKYRDVMRFFEACEQNWTETVYMALLNAMGSPDLKSPYTELARRLKYKYLCREKRTVIDLEALLLGTAGLLEKYEEDSYTRDLKETFRHLHGKYGITPLRPAVWDESKNHPNGMVTLRLAQLAAFFFKEDYLFENTIRCRTVADIQQLFDVAASMYWSTHYKPGAAANVFREKRLGAERANVLGINYVVPVLFAYGVYQSDESRKEAALELLEKINPEQNKYVNHWRGNGVLPENAFDTQAILQLHKEYCLKGLCWMCPVGKRIVKERYGMEAAQKM